MLTALGVFTEAELTSRFHVRLERYIKNLLIEVDTLRAMVDTQILPACYAYHTQLAAGVGAAKAAGVAAPELETLDQGLDSDHDARSPSAATLESRCAQGRNARRAKRRRPSSSPRTSPTRWPKFARPATSSSRSSPTTDWPLPKYREMLFLA